MGVTRENFKHYKKIKDEGLLDFKKKLKIIELGSQTIHFNDKDFFKEYLGHFELDENLADTFYYDMSNRFFHESIGHNYDCIDLDPLDPKAFFWNLNEKSCPEEYKNQYDLCTNHGTTEHLIGQTNSFQMMHDLTKPGGVMLSVLPCIDFNHGFFCYNPVFFESLAAANEYKIVGMYLMKSEPDAPLVDYYTGGEFILSPCYVHSILQKTTDKEFVNPSQIHINGVK
jgi:hypothetical protein